MNSQLGSPNQEFSILAVSSAGATASSSTGALPLHLPHQDYWRKARAGGAPQAAVAVTPSFSDSLKEDDSSQSSSDSLTCGATKSGTKRRERLNSEFSDSLEDSGEGTDETAVDSDSGSFYSVDSRLIHGTHSSIASLQNTEYFSESTLYNSAHSFNTLPSSHSSFFSIQSYDTLDSNFNSSASQSFGHRKRFYSQRGSGDHQEDISDISVDYTSCPDLSPIGIRRGEGQHVLPRLSSIQSCQTAHNGYFNNPSVRKSPPSRNKLVSSSSMSAFEGSASPKVGEEFEIKKKKGLMSSFRKSRKTSRKLRQQKKAAGDGDSTSTGTGVMSDGEQDFMADSEPSAPNSPAPVKSEILTNETNSVKSTIDKLEETSMDNKQVSHERLNGTAAPRESSEPNSVNASPAVIKSSKIVDTIKKIEEKEEKKITRSKFGSSLFRKKKTEAASTAPSTADASADAAATEAPEAPEVKEEEKGNEMKAEAEALTTEDDTQLAQSVETPDAEVPAPAEIKSSSFRSYISSVQFVKNWTVSSEEPKAQQTSVALAKTSLDADAVDEGKAEVDVTDSVPAGTEPTTTETKVATSINGKPTTTEVTSKKKTTVTGVAKSSPKLRNSATSIVRRAKAFASPSSPSAASPPKINFKSPAGKGSPSNSVKLPKSPPPVLPRHLSLEVITPSATDNPKPSWNNSGSSSPKRQLPPPVTVTPSEVYPKEPQSASVNQSPNPPQIPKDGSSQSKALPTIKSPQLKKVPMTESSQPKGSTTYEHQQPSKKTINEPKLPQKTTVNEPQQPQKTTIEPHQLQKIATESQQPQKATIESQQPQKTATESQQPLKTATESQQHQKAATEFQQPQKTVTEPQKPKETIVNEQLQQSKKMIHEPPKIVIDEPQHTKKFTDKESQQSELHQPKLTVGESQQMKETITETQHPQKIVNETHQLQKRVNEYQQVKNIANEPQPPKKTVTEHLQYRYAAASESHQPKKILVNEGQQAKKVPVSEPKQSAKVMLNEPQHLQKISVKEHTQPKNVPVDESRPSRKIFVGEPEQPVKIAVNESQPPKKIPAIDPQLPKKIPINEPEQAKRVPVRSSATTGAHHEEAITPTPVPFPVSTTPGMTTPPSSPEGHPGGDARETPEGDRTEHERNSLLESTGLTDSWAGASTDKREHLYKILVIGELGTGKTSIIKRYVHQFFSQHYRATIGVDFALKVLNWDSNTVIRLQLWDIAGQERFGNMTRVYYKEAVGAFVVFDVTRAQTFDAVTKWKTDLDTKVTLADGSPIPTVLLANKCDQPKEGVVNNPARMDDYCRERGFSGWFETSAKENINIDEASRFLVNKILSNEKQGMMMTESMDTDKFSVDGKTNPVDKSGCRC